MRVHVYRERTNFPDHHHEPAQLYLEAHTEADMNTLATLANNYVVIGCGRDPETMRYRHVEIELKPK